MGTACRGRGLVGRFVILAIGLVLLLDNLGVLAESAIFRWWPQS
jgi:hypothetical protein